MGTYCNTSNLPCSNLQSCQNDGTCINTNTTSYGYICACLTGFNGEYCELDNRLCTPSTCWNHGNSYIHPKENSKDLIIILFHCRYLSRNSKFNISLQLY